MRKRSLGDVRLTKTQLSIGGPRGALNRSSSRSHCCGFKQARVTCETSQVLLAGSRGTAVFAPPYDRLAQNELNNLDGP